MHKQLLQRFQKALDLWGKRKSDIELLVLKKHIKLEENIKGLKCRSLETSNIRSTSRSFAMFLTAKESRDVGINANIALEHGYVHCVLISHAA
ncbi:hypothetical protein M8J76_015318 [Diaphorina citri]|nr:hypothetical protein M8J76_015318 [Diaphorina citri]